MPDFLSHAPYLGIVVVMVLTGMGLPIPEEVVVISAGVASSLGELNPWGAFAACVVGALLGDYLVYLIGYHFGRGLLGKRAWWVRFLHPEREERIEAMIRHHGVKVFFLARFLVGIRGPVYLTVGILRVPFRRFALADTVSALMIIGLCFGLSYRYGEHIGALVREGQVVLTVAIVAGLAAVVGVYWWRRRRRAADAALEASASVALPERQPARAAEKPAA